jgi:hypothetical protein
MLLIILLKEYKMIKVNITYEAKLSFILIYISKAFDLNGVGDQYSAELSLYIENFLS